MSNDPSSEHRLPRAIRPTHYQLVLEPDIPHCRFAGNIRLTAVADVAADQLVLHASELEIDLIRIDGAPVEWRLDAETERLHIHQRIGRGPLVIEAEFRGVLNDKLRGFYRSTFTDEAGNEQTIATTQFQSTDARRCFPCFDEPDFKATFDVELLVDPDHLAVSNTAEIARTIEADGRHRVSFAETMVMSTYLVAFTIGPMSATPARQVGSTPVRVIAPPGKLHLASFALDVAEHCLTWFEDYYGLPYPGDKLDLVAIPDFAFGAMENLGCVTFREILLLVDPDSASQPELSNVALVIAHELAHMWFGDLVTMRWWNGIWLNEAFATFMELKATDAFRPDWEVWTTFGISRAAAFDIDALSSTRTIEYPVATPADAEGMFDILTYEKGGAVVRMLEQHLGEDRFRDGIRRYLARHAYGNTETHDLWVALDEVAATSVREMMETWIFQPGFPVITAVSGAGHIDVAQSRFAYTAGSNEDTESSAAGGGGVWHVPVVVRVGDETVRYLLTTERASIDVPAGPLLTGNAGGYGFYRFAPSAEQRDELIGSRLRERAPVERFGLLDDSWAMVLAGREPVADYLRTLDAFRDDEAPAVWQLAASSLSTLDQAAARESRDALAGFVRALTEPLVGRLGWQGASDEGPRIAELRNVLLRLAGTTGADDPVRTEARVRFDRDDPGDPTAPAVVSIIAATGTAADYDEFWRRISNAETPQIEQRHIRALGGFPGAAEIHRLFTDVEDGRIRSQDAPFVLRDALRNRAQGPMVWQFIADRWDALNERFPSNSIARMLEGIRSLMDPHTTQMVVEFLAAHPVPQGAKMVDQHVERMLVNVELGHRLEGRLLTPHDS